MKHALAILFACMLVGSPAIAQESKDTPKETSSATESSSEKKTPEKKSTKKKTTASSSTKSSTEKASSKKTDSKSRSTKTNSPKSAKSGSSKKKNGASSSKTSTTAKRQPTKGKPWESIASADLKKKADEMVKKMKTAERTKLLKMLNTGKPADLQKITGVGKERAQNIAKGRPYKKVEEVVNITGIGEKTFGEVIKYAAKL